MSGKPSEHIAGLNSKLFSTSRSFSVIIWTSIIVVFIITSLDIAGWIFNLTLLKSFGKEWEPMKLISAICFIISALSLIIIRLDFQSIFVRVFSFLLASLICFISLISLYRYLYLFTTSHESLVTNMSFFNQFLSPDRRMAFLTACCFFLIGIVFYLLQSKKNRAAGLAHLLIIPVFLISYFTLISYVLGVYDATSLNQVSVALNTGITFTAIGIAVLHLKPRTWLMKLHSRNSMGGIISRRLLFPAILLPIFIGWLRIQGERKGLFASEQGVVIVAITYTFCFIILIWVTGRSIEKIDRKQRSMERELRESEERFRTIAESLPVLIAIYNISDSNFSFINESFENTFGVTNGDPVQRKIHDFFFNPDDQNDLGRLLKDKGRAYNKELRVRKADGTPFWIMTSIRKISFMNEQAYLTASINITETKKAQEELLHLNRTLDAISKSSQAMMHTKNEFKYLDEVCKIIIKDCGHTMVWIGYAQNDEHKTVKPVAYYGFDKGYIDQLNVTWDDTERGSGPTGTAIRTGKPSLCKSMLTDPAFRPWRKAAMERGYASSLTLPLILEGKPFGSISIYSKEPDPFSESEINLLSNLADDLAYGISYIRLEESERTAANVIRENEAKLKELVATKDKFFNIVAHDLKNPFTSLLGSSELLFENIDQLSTESIQDLALILNDSAKSGYAILQNLLDWSRSQTGLLKINPENINLRNLTDENVSTFQLPAANKEIKMQNLVNEDIMVCTDKNMINTILRNLLSNALKFTYKSGKVIVRTKRTTGEVIVSVKDDGIGIPEEKIESLFNIEVKNSLPGTENEQGTGLGLKLTKEFVEKLGGRIWVESEEGKGSEFKFTIPLQGTTA